MDRFETLFRDGYPFEQQPPMRQQGDRWPETADEPQSGSDDDQGKPSDLNGN